MENSFFTPKEIKDLGFKKIGKNCLISRFTRFYEPSGISIGDNVRIDDFCILSGEIVLGSYIHIAPFCGLFGKSGIKLDDFAGLSSRVTIYTQSDDYLGKGLTNPIIEIKYRVIHEKEVTLGKHSLVGSGSIILPGGSLSEGSVLGAMSLLKDETAKWKIYAGVPAKYIKDRINEKIKILEKLFINETTGKKS